MADERGTEGAEPRERTFDERAVVRALFLLSFATSTLLTFVLLLARGGRWLPVVVALTAFTVGGWIVLRLLHERGRKAAWVLSLVTLNALLVAPELTLRLVDYRYESGVQFGYPKPSEMHEYVEDDDLFWVMKQGPGVNAHGFNERDVTTPKPAGERRVLFLGDSCVQQGYPAMVERELADAGDGDVRCLNYAIAGYTTHQGATAARKYGAALEPDLVYVSYGWNDHWLAFERQDHERTGAAGISRLGPSLDRLMGLRVVQALFRLRDVLSGEAAREPLGVVRVPPERYRSNLASITATFRELGVPVVLIAPPSAHPERGVPELLLERKLARTADDVLRRHAAYNDTVRALASEPGCAVLDLDRVFAELPDAMRSRVYRDDGIHFTPRGLRFIAATIAADARRRRAAAFPDSALSVR